MIICFNTWLIYVYFSVKFLWNFKKSFLKKLPLKNSKNWFHIIFWAKFSFGIGLIYRTFFSTEVLFQGRSFGLNIGAALEILVRQNGVIFGKIGFYCIFMWQFQNIGAAAAVLPHLELRLCKYVHTFDLILQNWINWIRAIILIYTTFIQLKCYKTSGKWNLMVINQFQ